MDLPRLQNLITRSTLLTAEEKQYWLGILPTMTEKHIASLEKILSEAEKVPLAQSMHDYIHTVRKSSTTPLAA